MMTSASAKPLAMSPFSRQRQPIPFATTRRRLLAGFVAIAATRVRVEAQSSITIAAAADLRHALDAIIAKFEIANGTNIRATYGSSGNLARQIAQGAPFELFLSADESYAIHLVAESQAEGPGIIYGVGRLALIARREGRIDAERGLVALSEAVAGHALSRFAIANPEHAPYGARAREVLQKSQLWEPLQSGMVLAENVAQAAQYVMTGAAEAGITALPLVKTGPAAEALRYSLVPADLHTPLRQRMVLTKRASPAARALYAFIASAEAQVILRASGFEQP